MTGTSPEGKKITVIIVDDHRAFAGAMAVALNQEPDLQVVGTLATCAAVRDSLANMCPDVLLLDLALPDGDGLTLVPFVRQTCNKTSILVLTSLADEAALRRAINAGVDGFMGKTQAFSEVTTGIRQAAVGEIVIPRSLLIAVVMHTSHIRKRKPTTGAAGSLTPRELEIVSRLARGKSAAAIADEFSIAPITVRTHIRNIMEKLGVHSRLEAITFAIRNGWVDPLT